LIQPGQSTLGERLLYNELFWFTKTHAQVFVLYRFHADDCKIEINIHNLVKSDIENRVLRMKLTFSAFEKTVLALLQQQNSLFVEILRRLLCETEHLLLVEPHIALQPKFRNF
jgi:hypothetical protein